MREWVVKRRARTKQLIELGGLVVKAGLVDLTDDDRRALYGAFLAVADKLCGDDREHALALWHRKGKRAFAKASPRSEEHTSELQSLIRTSYAVFGLKKNTQQQY